MNTVREIYIVVSWWRLSEMTNFANRARRWQKSFLSLSQSVQEKRSEGRRLCPLSSLSSFLLQLLSCLEISIPTSICVTRRPPGGVSTSFQRSPDPRHLPNQLLLIQPVTVCVCMYTETPVSGILLADRVRFQATPEVGVTCAWLFAVPPRSPRDRLAGRVARAGDGDDFC